MSAFAHEDHGRDLHVFKAQRPNGGDLRDVLTRLCPVEMGRVASQNDDGWKGLQANTECLALAE